MGLDFGFRLERVCASTSALRLLFGMHVGVGIDRDCELWNGDRKMGRKMRMVFDNILQKFCRADLG